MKINVHRGTVRTGEHLCATCTYGYKIRGDGNLDQTICKNGMFPFTRGVVTQGVSECSGYHDSTVPYAGSYLESSWVCYRTVKGRVVFRPYRELPEKEREKVDLDT